MTTASLCVLFSFLQLLLLVNELLFSLLINFNTIFNSGKKYCNKGFPFKLRHYIICLMLNSVNFNDGEICLLLHPINFNGGNFTVHIYFDNYKFYTDLYIYEMIIVCCKHMMQNYPVTITGVASVLHAVDDPG